MSCEKFLDDIIKLISSPEENFEKGINLLEQNLFRYDDIRLAILGSFLSSKWFVNSENKFINFLNKKFDNQNCEMQAIIKYLQAYDIYMKNQISDVFEYKIMIECLEESINLYSGHVNNYVLLAEYSKKRHKKVLLNIAKNNVKEVWNNYTDTGFDYTYDSYIAEHIIGTSMTNYRYNELFK